MEITASGLKWLKKVLPIVSDVASYSRYIGVPMVQTMASLEWARNHRWLWLGSFPIMNDNSIGSVSPGSQALAAVLNVMYGRKAKMYKSFLMLFLFLLGSEASASPHSSSGKIVDVLMGEGLSGKAIFYVENFQSAGSCPVHPGSGLIVISVPDSENFDSFLSMALMSYATGKEVKVTIDDSKTDQHGRCNLTRFRLNKEF